jgi:hypothetical protein
MKEHTYTVLLTGLYSNPSERSVCLGWPNRWGSSVSDVEGISQGLVKPCAAHLVQPAYRLRIENLLRNGEDSVAVHDADLGKPLWLADLDFGTDASDCPSDRGTGHRAEHCNCCVSRQNANGPATRRGTEVSPVDVAPRYHSRAVSAARRRAASTI